MIETLFHVAPLSIAMAVVASSAVAYPIAAVPLPSKTLANFAFPACLPSSRRSWYVAPSGTLPTHTVVAAYILRRVPFPHPLPLPPHCCWKLGFHAGVHEPP